MLFTDPAFLFIFLPILLAVYFLGVSMTAREAPTGQRNASRANIVLLVGSVLFYADSGGTFTWMIIAAVAVNYRTARGIDWAQQSDTSAVPEALLTIAITGNLVLLKQIPLVPSTWPWYS